MMRNGNEEHISIKKYMDLKNKENVTNKAKKIDITYYR